MRREMWKRLQRSVIEYRPSWCRATKRARSVMGVVSFQGMKYLHALRSRVLPMYPVQSVTYVTGSYNRGAHPRGGRDRVLRHSSGSPSNPGGGERDRSSAAFLGISPPRGWQRHDSSLLWLGCRWTSWFRSSPTDCGVNTH